jgi:hypothetical protein
MIKPSKWTPDKNHRILMIKLPVILLQSSSVFSDGQSSHSEVQVVPGLRFSDGQACLSNVNCRLVALLQVAKQLLLDFGSQMDSPASVM